MSQLILELDKQRALLRENISELIQESVEPLQTSVDALRETANHFNISEGSGKGWGPKELISDLLMENLSPDVLSIGTRHRSLAPNPGSEGKLRDFVIHFHRFQEREKVLSLARQHERNYHGTTLSIPRRPRIEPLSTKSSKSSIRKERGLSFSSLRTCKFHMTMKRSQHYILNLRHPQLPSQSR